MRRETDLAAVKSLARALLMLEPEETEFSPMVVKHPFTDSGIVDPKYLRDVTAVQTMQYTQEMKG